MKCLTAAWLCLIAWNTSPVFASDYVLKLEMTTEVEARVGEGKSIKTSDVRTLEILITPDRRFHGKTTWENQRLAIKGKLTEEKDGTLRLDIRCALAVKVVAPEKSDDGSSPPDFENRSTANTTLGIAPGQPLTLGGFGSSQTIETSDGNREESKMKTFRVTVVEDNDTKS